MLFVVNEFDISNKFDLLIRVCSESRKVVKRCSGLTKISISVLKPFVNEKKSDMVLRAYKLRRVRVPVVTESLGKVSAGKVVWRSSSRVY